MDKRAEQWRELVSKCNRHTIVELADEYKS